MLRRPVAERAQDIGAWFYILTVISQLAVISNAFLIAITAQLVPIEVYAYGYRYVYMTVEALVTIRLDETSPNANIGLIQ